MKVLIVIPARMSSTRFPGKPLVSIRGCSMIERVWRIAKASCADASVVVATDDGTLKTAVEKFGAQVVLTDETCRTGTDRAAQALQRIGQAFDRVVSLQADAVLTPPWVIDMLIEHSMRDPAIEIVTPALRLSGEALQRFIAKKQGGSTTGTTVVVSGNGNALYFSKGIVPTARNEADRDYLLQHIGMYIYRVDAIKRMAALPESRLERIEKLEQLRALENGMSIRVVEVDYRGRSHGSVDNPEDVANIEAIIEAEGELVAQ